MNRIKYKLNWIKENLSIILIIPALIGGLWQIIELSYISTSYLRFFSPTQVISDGLLVLFVLTLIYLFSRLSLKHIDFSNFKKKKYEPFTWKKFITNFFLIILQISLIGILSYYYITPAYLEFLNDVSVIVFLFLISCNIIILIYISYILFDIVYLIISIPIIKERIEKNREEKQVDKKKESIFSFIIFSILFVLFFKFIFLPTLGLIGKFRKNFILPYNLKNLDYIECKINKTYSESLKHKVLYLNDSYIFVEVEKNKELKDILILKFEDLLKNNCK
ncbi:hypothetical protein [Tenacibaculum agarivorans]|uniref:hypothetical protein n=1 Tax=Tenacibaculum agarivorans TaxID=1908389 RepID=UPI00094B9281|nr:hypothetical protein [Tenacibaculum agarivorans]